MLEMRTKAAATIIALSFAVCASAAASTVWTEESKQSFPLAVDGVSALYVRTHNGDIAFDGDQAGDPVVHVTMKAGGKDAQDAAAALAAVEVFIEPGDKQSTKIGWRWSKPKKDSWQNQVSFDITASGQIHIDAATHNGAVSVTNADKGVSLETHNGAITASKINGDVAVRGHNSEIEIDSGGGKLDCKAHNGKITVAYRGADIRLETHNGIITADISECSTIGGAISTHNGTINLIVGSETSAQIDGTTNTGAVSLNAPLHNVSISRRALHGTLGKGDTSLKLSTHNGKIAIRTAN